MKRILFGTRNQVKLDLFREILATLPVEVLSPQDLSIDIEVKEDGSSPEENAEKKAQAYFATSRMPTLAIDAGLHIAKFPHEKQPGVFVRRIRGGDEDVSDEMVLDYSRRELERVGGESPGTWSVCVALMTAPGRLFSQTYSFEMVFTSKPSPVLITGAPLSSLMMNPATGEYRSETAYEEWPDAKWYVEFVRQHLKELE
jgi:8-oxo-dGTP diphosphatase